MELYTELSTLSTPFLKLKLKFLGIAQRTNVLSLFNRITKILQFLGLSKLTENGRQFNEKSTANDITVGCALLFGW